MANRLSPYLPFFLRRLIFQKIHQKLGGALLFFGSGSAPLDLKLAKAWENLGVEIFEGYGATETTAALTLNTPSAKKLGSVGQVLPGMEVRLNPQTGEIETRGPNISPGYFEDEEKTKVAFVVYPEGTSSAYPDEGGSWYKTGDVGEFDQNGFLYLTGREAFRIVLPNGQKVYPEDLEKKLNAHPLIKEACVVGVKREEGEVVHAAVITEYPSKLEEIVRAVNQKLASHEQILEWSRWQGDDFPRTPILKIDRRRVLEKASGRVTKEAKPPAKIQDPLTSLLSQVTKVPLKKIKEDSTLATDLKLDSLARVELLSLIEQEFGVGISETKITPQTTIEQLRARVKEAPATIEEIKINEFIYSPLMFRLRTAILENLLAFPLHAAFVPLEIKGREKLASLTGPAIFYFNHLGILDGVCVLRALPDSIRQRLVIAVNADLWQDYRKPWVEIFGGSFPFDKKGKIKASLELAGEFLDRGFSLLLSPEGTFSKTGKLLEFKPGIGLLAVEAQIPVVPFKIDPSYLKIFPPMGGSFWENFPKKRKKITLTIGQPLTFTKDTPYDWAAQKMREQIEKL